MSDTPTSMLLVAKDADLLATVDQLFGEDAGVQITSRPMDLSEVNGSAASMAKGHDVLLVNADPVEPGTIDTVRAMSEARGPNSMLVAVTSEDLPLSQAKLLSRAGADDVMPRDAVSSDLPRQLEDWKARRDSRLPAVWTGPQTVGHVLAVAGARGGIGKSTIAVNLADALQGKRGLWRNRPQASVAIVDLDLQFGSVATLLDAEANDGLYRMAMDGSVPGPDDVDTICTRCERGLTVIAAPTRFTPLEALTGAQVSAILDRLTATHDYVIVDLPCVLATWMAPVLSRASRLFLATDVTVPSVRVSRKLIDFFRSEEPDLDIEVVISTEARPLLRGQHHQEASKLLECEFNHWIPEDTRTAREMLDTGKTALEVAPRSRLARAIGKLARDTARSLPARVVSPHVIH